MNIPSYFDSIESKDTKFKLEKKKGLDLRKILEIENQLNVKLPDDLVTFYLYSNGLDGDDWIFNIIPLTEVEKLGDIEGEYLSFAEYMIYSETCGLEIDQDDKNKYKFFTHIADIEKEGIKRKYACNSISDFIILYCDQGMFGVFGDK